MVFDSIANASVPSAPISKDFSKKKRVNRSAKLKQCKLDARREQWLSQGAVKNKECKKDSVCDGKKDTSLENLEIRRSKKEEERSIHHGSYLESPSHSPTSSIGSVLCQNDSLTNYSGSSSSSISSRSGWCYSGSMTEEEEEGGGGCLDDWESVADALAADDKQQNPHLEIPSECKILTETRDADNKPESQRSIPKAPMSTRAWRPDDDFRPQSLPNLYKQYSLPELDLQYACGGVPWARNGVISVPSSCPICFEDLDLTDSCFLPCVCGFRLCLFCHKRILEDDGRCPGCRKPYVHDPVEADASAHGGSMTVKLARSYSMITRF